MAFLDVLDRYALSVSEIIYVDVPYRLPTSLDREREKFGYDRFFNIREHPYYKATTVLGRPPITVTASDINSPNIRTAIESLSSRYVLFTGGGIVSPETLNLGKHLVHIHPGALPERRGSTCFYYSLLEDNLLESSSFLMSQKLDSGRVLVAKKFKPNFRVMGFQGGFMEHILDCLLRAELLPETIRLLESNSFESEYHAPKIDVKGSLYFQIHPVLRGIAANKLEEIYDPKKTEGLEECVY